MPGYIGRLHNRPDFETIIESIYDCAANPEQWTHTLSLIRDKLGSAYAMVGLTDTTNIVLGGNLIMSRHHSPCDERILDDLQKRAPEIPGLQEFLALDPDHSWSQMGSMPEEKFKETQFYKEWVQPNGFRDVVNVPYIKRNTMIGMLSIVREEQHEIFNQKDCAIAEMLSPHIRRAMMINDLADKGRLALQLYRSVIDQLSAAIFVVSFGRRIVIANASAEELLKEGHFLSSQNGALTATRVTGQVGALDAAIERALKGDRAIGIAGIGVPLIGADGARAAAYVLPVAGNDIRGSFGPGHCMVFVARRGEQQPIVMEILRTLYDLTATEARVAMLIASGDGPAAIAESLDVGINTVRTHLKHAFAKTETQDQTSLGGLINSLAPPLLVK